ncbi:undecaprenyl-phosphate glucose phosphotransferase [Hyphomicrobium methylovorum]|uniref:undecaprenyl-phosphate glucose phosphotransferase n=1 Tax=Hyphomicrobium methylovorum TaxID=84 RepID=UPI001FE3370D|nr:undecaprenyl-phosphate glucose phosphotransferase [Hyphomicrobium methylovorum]MBA2127635.1 undecaprenyl-phosphate glucose phosphotransferase [Hyphomicrobium methylovorum]
MALSHSMLTSTVINFADAKLAHRAARRPKLIDDRRTAAQSTMSPVVVRGSIRAIEFLTVALLGLAIAQLYVDTGVLQNTTYPLATALVGAATVFGFGMLNLYSLHALSAYVRNMPTVMLGWTTAFAALVAGVFFLKIGQDVSRVWLLTWFASGALALIAIRVAAGCFVKAAARSGRLCQRAAIYGTGPVAQALIDDLEADPNSIVRIAGVFDDRGDARAPSEISGYPNLGGVDDLIRMSRAKTLDLVIVSLPLAAEARLSNLATRLSVLPAAIKMPARAAGIRFSPHTYSHVGSVAMIDLFDKPISDWNSVSKWLFDKIVGTVALALFAPLMLIIALAVKLESRGPVLFRQKRYGFNNELIEVLKFRSMYTDRCDATASKLVTKNDPRVTRVGRFIRKTSLDELPQLINVLCGSLSLVGPRPHAVKAKAGDQLYDEVVDGYFARHKVKPGITGWAQINGWRGETDTEEKIEKRVEHDLYYIENWSVFLDLSILLKTPIALLKTENAY